MVAEVILHIGMHKTGTTSIQSALNNFDNGRVRYARLSDVNHSIPIYSLFSKNAHNYHIHKNMGRSRYSIDMFNGNTVTDLERELSMDRETIIISGEDISTLDANEVGALVTWLKARTKSLKVLAYVREPVGFASSAIQQYISGGMRKTFIPTPDYRKRFEAYTQCPEVASIEFVQFNKDMLVNESVVADFCSRVGLDGSGLKDNRTNESVSHECTQLLYHLNRFGIPTSGSPALVKTRKQFSHYLNQNFNGDSYKVPSELVWTYADMNDIRWMEETSGIQLSPTGMDNKVSAKTDSPEALEHAMEDIDKSTLRTLQGIVSDIDTAVGKETNVAKLLNFLFASFYFKEAYAQNNAA